MTPAKVVLLLVSCACIQATAEEIRIGALLKDAGTDQLGARALQLWLTWVNSAANTLGFTVAFTETVYNADTMAADVAAMAAANDVLIPPYTSGLVQSFVDAVPADFTGPILAWGGASDAICSSNCVGKPCFGTFSVGSQYMVGALTALLAKSEKPLRVALIQNDNGFSRSVCAGARDFIAKTQNLLAINDANVEVVRGAISDADKAQVTELMGMEPDVVAVCGHSGGDIEDVIMTIAEHTHRAHAVIATNSITSGARTRFAEMGTEALMNCLIMPTQWGMSESSDPNIGWTSSAFAGAFGTDVSYHAASMAGALVALTEAIAQGASDATNRVSNLATLMRSVDIDTFYGSVAFNADGSIKKPMSFQQLQGDMSPVFSNMYGSLHGDLKMCNGWGTPMTCAHVKQSYKAGGCCGNPSKEFDMAQMSR